MLLPFNLHNILNIFAISQYNWSYIIFLLHFGANTVGVQPDKKILQKPVAVSEGKDLLSDITLSFVEAFCFIKVIVLHLHMKIIFFS